MRTVRQWVGETAGGLPRGYWYLWGNTLINRVGSFVIILLAIYLTQDRHLSPSFAGFVIGLWGAGGALGALLGGVLADRWGRKPTFLTSLYSSAVMMLVLGLAEGRLAIALAVLVLGVVSEAARPALSALMIDIVPERDRMRAFSLQYWVINLGFAIAATTAGLVAGADFRLLFLIDATTTTAAATLVAIKVREPRRVVATATRAGGRTGQNRSAGAGGDGGAAPAAPRRGSAGPGLRTVFADKVFMTFVGTNVLTAIVFLQHISTLPMSMARDGLSPATFGLVIALNGILIVAGQLFMGKMLNWGKRSTTLAAAALIMGIGFGLNAFAGTVWLYAVAVLIWTFGEMLNAPSNSTTNAELSPAHLRGRYQGVFTLSWSVAGFVAPIAGSAVLQYAGTTTLWLGCLALALVVAVSHLLAGPARERRTAELAANELAATELAATELAATERLTAEAAQGAVAERTVPRAVRLDRKADRGEPAGDWPAPELAAAER
ncbi:MAG TPA: MFS transporter, partial [Micromonosporaceae bacterium]